MAAFARDETLVDEAIAYATTVLVALARGEQAERALARGAELLAEALEAQAAHCYAALPPDADGGRAYELVCSSLGAWARGAGSPVPPQLALPAAAVVALDMGPTPFADPAGGAAWVLLPARPAPPDPDDVGAAAEEGAEGLLALVAPAHPVAWPGGALGRFAATAAALLRSAHALPVDAPAAAVAEEGRELARRRELAGWLHLGAEERDAAPAAIVAELAGLLPVERVALWWVVEPTQYLHTWRGRAPAPAAAARPLEPAVAAALAAGSALEEEEEEGWRLLLPLAVEETPLAVLDLAGAGAASGERVRRVAALGARALQERLGAAVAVERGHALRRAEAARLREIGRLWAAVRDPLLSLSPLGVIRAASAPAERALGAATAALEGRALHEWVVEEDRPLLTAALGALAGGAAGQTLELHLGEEGAARRWTWTLAGDPREPLVTALGHPLPAAAPPRAAAAADDWARGLGAGLRGTVVDALRAVAGPLAVLRHRHGPALGAEGLAAIAAVDEGVRAARELVVRLAGYADAAARPLVPAPVALAGAVARARATRAAELRAGGAELRVDAALPTVVGDPVLLELLIEELLLNAVRFAAPGRAPRVAIAAARDDDEPGTTLTVQDNGVGIAPEDLQALGGLFVRLHPSHPGSGAGLGFALARLIAARHGGWISVASRPLAGTRVTVGLPDVAVGGS